MLFFVIRFCFCILIIHQVTSIKCLQNSNIVHRLDSIFSFRIPRNSRSIYVYSYNSLCTRIPSCFHGCFFENNIFHFPLNNPKLFSRILMIYFLPICFILLGPYLCAIKPPKSPSASIFSPFVYPFIGLSINLSLSSPPLASHSLFHVFSSITAHTHSSFSSFLSVPSSSPRFLALGDRAFKLA